MLGVLLHWEAVRGAVNGDGQGLNYPTNDLDRLSTGDK